MIEIDFASHVAPRILYTLDESDAALTAVPGGWEADWSSQVQTSLVSGGGPVYAAPLVRVATLAARALRAIPSEARSEQSRANGRRGGRPVLMILVDDLGRSVGYCEAAGSRAGEIVEYGSRILARTRPDGYIEPQTFRVEGRATLRRTRPADREDIRYNSREWDVQ